MIHVCSLPRVKRIQAAHGFFRHSSGQHWQIHRRGWAQNKVEKESEWERQKIEYPKIELLIIYISYSPLRRPKMTISKPKGIQGCPIFHFGRWSPAIAIWCPSQRRLRCCCRSSAESGRAATMHLGWTCRCVWRPEKHTILKPFERKPNEHDTLKLINYQFGVPCSELLLV